MPRLNIIVLTTTADDANTYNVAFWADVPVARQSFYANASAKSQWAGATAADNTNLQNGSVVELVKPYRVPSTSTLAQVEAALQAQWAAYQNFITNFNPWAHYGSTWDGTTWSVVTVT